MVHKVETKIVKVGTQEMERDFKTNSRGPGLNRCAFNNGKTLATKTDKSGIGKCFHE